MARQSHPLPVLLTRPAAQSARFASQLMHRFGLGLRVVISPLIAPFPSSPVLPDLPWTAIILTSETGAQMANALSGLPRTAYCVGDQTAKAAREAGFHAVSANGDADALIALILAAGVTGPLLHLRGAESRGDVAARLIAAGVQAHAAIVYHQDAQPLLPEAALLLQGSDPVLVPLFSPRTARLFSLQAQDATAPMLIAALSPAVAMDCPPAALISIATSPDAAAMLTTIAQMLDQWAITRHPS